MVRVAELHIARIEGGDNEGIYGVRINEPGTRKILARFELSGDSLMEALSGKVTRVELIEGRKK